LFLKLTAFVAAAGALETVPSAAQTLPAAPAPPAHLQPPGLYRISGQVQLDAPLVQISGITNAQQISWAGAPTGSRPVASFSSFESFDRPWQMPEISVRGGTLQTLAVTPVLLS